MTSNEFIIWLKGFTEGVHEFNITPKQWDLLKEELAKVNDYPYSVSVGTGGTGTPNFAITTGHTGTAVGYSFPGTTVNYTASSGSAFSYTNTTNDKTLLND